MKQQKISKILLSIMMLLSIVMGLPTNIWASDETEKLVFYTLPNESIFEEAKISLEDHLPEGFVRVVYDKEKLTGDILDLTLFINTKVYYNNDKDYRSAAINHAVKLDKNKNFVDVPVFQSTNKMDFIVVLYDSTIYRKLDSQNIHELPSLLTVRSAFVQQDMGKAFRSVDSLFSYTVYQEIGEQRPINSKPLDESLHYIFGLKLQTKEEIDQYLDTILSKLKYDTDFKFYNKNALQTIKRGEGICYDFALLTDNILKSAGIESRIVYGDMKRSDEKNPIYHSWVEYKLDGEWFVYDPTYTVASGSSEYSYGVENNRGYTLNKIFVY